MTTVVRYQIVALRALPVYVLIMTSFYVTL